MLGWVDRVIFPVRHLERPLGAVLDLLFGQSHLGLGLQLVALGLRVHTLLEPDAHLLLGLFVYDDVDLFCHVLLSLEVVPLSLLIQCVR